MYKTVVPVWHPNLELKALNINNYYYNTGTFVDLTLASG